ncbi:MAG: ABC transporter permease [Ruminococcus sp.]|nr:ABC transporter permease [Ruminococcus sp.]
MLQMKILEKVNRYKFLFSELVKRDFKQKYKRTVLGMVWSALSPICSFIILKFVFENFFGRGEHYTTYLFIGIMVNSFFAESTNNGMFSLVANGGIISKVNVPKYIFLLSKNVSCLINFGITFVIFLVFAYIDHITFTPTMLLIVYPVLCLIVFNIGVGLILSALFVFFRDIQYIYSIFTQLLYYVSAIFYTVDALPEHVQKILMINPIYDYISYVRIVTINGVVPDLTLHLLCAGYALLMLVIGMIVYKVNNYKFVFYF